jgi:hypothetical protein
MSYHTVTFAHRLATPARHPTMPTNTTDPGDGPPTTGPATASYEQYRYVTTENSALIYDVDRPDRWIEADLILDLGDWQ